MAIDYIRNIISSGYNLAKINDNFVKIQESLQDGLSRSGNGPNQMSADLDMNSNDILNIHTLQVQDLTIDGTNPAGILERAQEAAEAAEASALEATTVVANIQVIADEAAASAVDAEASAVAAAASAAAVDLPAITANTMLVDNAAGTARESKTFEEVKTLLDIQVDPPTQNFTRNGNFDFWRGGVSQTGNGFISCDDWFHYHQGSTKTITRQPFTPGQTDVPGNPEAWFRTVVVSTAAAGNYVFSNQLLGRYRNFAGKTYTLTFWAKADAAKNIAVSLEGNVGTGGSPSANPAPIVNTAALTTSWQKFTYLVTFPTSSGVTFGSSQNSELKMFFWFDAGSTYNARTNSLGQRNGTYDVARVSLVVGDHTAVADPWTMFPYPAERALSVNFPGKNNVQCNYDMHRHAGSPVTVSNVSGGFFAPGAAATASSFTLWSVRRKLVFARWVLVWTPNSTGSGTAVGLMHAGSGFVGPSTIIQTPHTTGTTPIAWAYDVTQAIARIVEENRVSGSTPDRQIYHLLSGDGTNSPQVYGSWLETVWDVDPD